MSFIPNTTPTPNWLYNGEMKKMSDVELRVVLVVTRATLGWIADKETGMRKAEDWISHTELIKKTGKSSRAISNAVDSCVKHGWIETRDKKGFLLKTPDERRRRRIFYRLGTIFTDKLSTANNTVDENLPQIETESTANNNTNLPQKRRNTKETLTKEIIPNLSSKDDEWDFSKELLKLKDSSRKGMKISALYWVRKGYGFENKDQFQKALKRELRPASMLTGYNSRQINEAIDYCSEEYEVWSLETIGKRITDLVNKK
jgi:DNA-binding MarR family transcriptional regulator